MQFAFAAEMYSCTSETNIQELNLERQQPKINSPKNDCTDKYIYLKTIRKIFSATSETDYFMYQLWGTRLYFAKLLVD